MMLVSENSILEDNADLELCNDASHITQYFAELLSHLAITKITRTSLSIMAT